MPNRENAWNPNHQDLDKGGEDPVPFTVVRVSSSVSQVRPEVNVLKDQKKSSKKQPQGRIVQK